MWDKVVEKNARELAVGVAQTVLYSRKNIDGEIIEAYKQKDFEKICVDTGLEMEDALKYVFWPSFFDKESSLDKKIINVCTVCFGTLSLIRAYEMNLYSEENTNTVKRTINAAVNTLIYLRGNEGEWPPHWEIGKGRMSNAGSMNQTAVCLTVLLRCGFFEEKTLYSDDLIDVEQRKARIQLLLQSMEWIMKAQSRELPKCGWDYAKNKSGTLSIMATANVIDLIIKVCSLVQKDELIKEIFQLHKPGLLEEMQDTVTYLLHYYEGIQNADGGYSKIHNEGEQTDSSMLHTLYGTNVLLANQTINEDNVRSAVKYICRQYRDEDWSKKHEEQCFEQYSYTALAPFVSDKGDIKYMENYIEERFEIFPCSLVITSLCNIYNKVPDIINEKKLKRMIEGQWLQIAGRICKTDEGGIIVKGNRRLKGSEYPMYILYYTLLSYKYMLESQLVFSPQKRLNSDYVKISIVFIVFIVVTIGSAIISGWKDFWVWSLTGISASALAWLIGKMKK